MSRVDNIADVESVSPLVDSYDRNVTSLRISITRNCDLSCFYCHNEGMRREEREMTPGEIEELATIASDLGITRVKLTGGEPLVRLDVVEIVGRLSVLFDEVSMTTNALGLVELARPLKEAGMTRVNISLNTLREDRYKQINGSDRLKDALDGLEAALRADLAPVKINMVLLKGINDDEVPAMVAFAAEKGAILQIIELETERENICCELFDTYHRDPMSVHSWLASIGRKNGANPLHHRERFIVDRIPDSTPLPAPAVVEMVMPMHNTTFCANCTRIRLTAGGFIKGCLFQSDSVEDVLKPLREGAPVEHLKDQILKVVMERKPYWTD
jgi:cyclic pyranopterin phosphate synthase